jgi:uncharacterized protein
MKLPDVNVLLYAANADSTHHTEAKVWVESSFAATSGVGFAWVVLLGLIRIATRSGVFERPLPVERALAFVHAWLADPAAAILKPGDRHESLLARLLVGAGTAGNLTTDAHLAALAIEHGATLASFDHDFTRFPGLDVELPGGRCRSVRRQSA